MLITVLTPELTQYTCAPVPYLIGLLKNDKSVEGELRRLPIGECLVVDLETRNLQLRGSTQTDWIGDITNTGEFGSDTSNNSVGASATNVGVQLVSDLIAISKADKKRRSGETNSSVGGKIVADGIGKVKGMFKKMKKKSSGSSDDFRDSNNFNGSNVGEIYDDSINYGRISNNSSSELSNNLWDPLYAPPNSTQHTAEYVELIQPNRKQADELKRTLTSFFLFLMGDPTLLLGDVTRSGIDKDKYVSSMRRRIDPHNRTQDNGMIRLVRLFSQSQMFENYARERIRLMGGLRGGGVNDVNDESDSDDKVAGIDFRKLGDIIMSSSRHNFADPGSIVHVVNSYFDAKNGTTGGSFENQKVNQAVSLCMSLTSNKINDKNPGFNERERIRLVEMCYVGSRATDIPDQEFGDLDDIVLFDTVKTDHEVSNALMNTLWSRILDSRGLNWRHAHLSLLIIGKILLHGPVTLVSELMDRLEYFRHLSKTYSSQVGGGVAVRVESEYLVKLLINHKKLFCEREFLRRGGKTSARKSGLLRDVKRIRFGKFADVHQNSRPIDMKLGKAAPAVVKRPSRAGRAGRAGVVSDGAGAGIGVGVGVGGGEVDYDDISNLLNLETFQISQHGGHQHAQQAQQPPGRLPEQNIPQPQTQIQQPHIQQQQDDPFAAIPTFPSNQQNNIESNPFDNFQSSEGGGIGSDPWDVNTSSFDFAQPPPTPAPAPALAPAPAPAPGSIIDPFAGNTAFTVPNQNLQQQQQYSQQRQQQPNVFAAMPSPALMQQQQHQQQQQGQQPHQKENGDPFASLAQF